MLPENVTAIVSFLLANGYSDNAAAGIAGNMYQESKGNPESEGMGGGGLIGFTPLPAGYVTGNAAADLQTQLSAVLTYNQQWSAYLPALNSAATPADAADIYVTDFERAGIPAAATREASAEDVAERLRHLGPSSPAGPSPPEETGRPARASPSPSLLSRGLPRPGLGRPGLPQPGPQAGASPPRLPRRPGPPFSPGFPSRRAPGGPTPQPARPMSGLAG